MSSFARLVLVVLSAALATRPVLHAQSAPGPAEHWITTWHTAVVPREPVPQGQAPAAQAPFTVSNQTLRQIVRVSAGGNRVRVIFSNAFGTAPLAIGAATVALRQAGPAVLRPSVTPLTFDGRASATIPPGAVLVSDAAALVLPTASDLVIDAYLPGDTAAGTSPLTMHGLARSTNYLSEAGNHAGAASLPVARTTESWYFITGVEVVGPASAFSIAALGDSITDGNGSTVDGNVRWPDVLAARLAARSSLAKIGIVNAGIAGNRVLSGVTPNALARFDRDVVAPSGVTHVLFMEGINDIRVTPQNPNSIPLADLIAGHRQIIARAHAKGVRIYGATLTPYEGTTGWTKETDDTRQALNAWIRTGKDYDGMVDFDAVVRDPVQPARLQAQYDSGDHLHPNDAAYKAMADAVDLTLFMPAPRRLPSGTK